MIADDLYTSIDIEKTYEQVYDLLVTKDIIKTYSTNKGDIRINAIEGLDLSESKIILELGCGYGFFIEVLKNKIHKDADITGIDIVENNRDAYLHNLSSIGYSGKFIHGLVDTIINYPSEKYDLIIASYSLYFFPHIISEISRILKPNGYFIAVTHSKDSLYTAVQIIIKSLNLAGIYYKNEIALSKLFNNFSIENGLIKLNNYFKNISVIEFENSLIFPEDNIEDCMYYIEKKKNLIYKEILDLNPEKIDEFKKIIYREIKKYSKLHHNIILNKNDAIFRCRK